MLLSPQGGRFRVWNEDAKPLRMCVRFRALFSLPCKRKPAVQRTVSRVADIAWMDGQGKGHVRNYHINGARAIARRLFLFKTFSAQFATAHAVAPPCSSQG